MNISVILYQNIKIVSITRQAISEVLQNFSQCGNLKQGFTGSDILTISFYCHYVSGLSMMFPSKYLEQIGLWEKSRPPPNGIQTFQDVNKEPLDEGCLAMKNHFIL